MIKRFREPAGPSWAHALYRQPFFGSGCKNGAGCAESLEKSACSLHGDSRYGCQQCFGRQSARVRGFPLRVRGLIASTVPLSTMSQPVEPQRRVFEIVGAQHPDLLIDYGQERTADRVRRHRSIVQIGTLDQQIRTRIPPDALDLSPQPTLNKGQMEASDCLTLNDSACSKEKVTGREVSSRNRRPKFLEQATRSRPLVHVDNDPDRLIDHPPLSLHRQAEPNCVNFFHEVERR